VFEGHYSFDLEFLKKQNLGKAVEHIEKFNGVTPFGVAYVTQNALGGHAIPVNQGVFQILQLVGVLTEAEAAKKRVPGMERAIPKTKGVEFGSLLHQLGVDFATAPNGARVRTVVLEIAPEAKDRLPKRSGTKKEGEPRESEPESKPPSPREDSPTAASSPTTVASKDVPKAGDETESSRRAAAANGGGESAAKSASKRLSRKKPR
jgi:endonuclease-3